MHECLCMVYVNVVAGVPPATRIHECLGPADSLPAGSGLLDHSSALSDTNIGHTREPCMLFGAVPRGTVRWPCVVAGPVGEVPVAGWGRIRLLHASLPTILTGCCPCCLLPSL